LYNTKIDEDILGSLIELLPEIRNFHNPSSALYQYISKVSSMAVQAFYGPESKGSANLGSLGQINLPFYSMGSINSTHLFGLDELILFSFYNRNRNTYSKVADLGANIGLHSIILSNLGFDVTSYEPDKTHLKKFRDHIELNCADKSPFIINKAISTEKGNVEFIRVKGNTTSSHIKGSKNFPYGELETYKVETDSFTDLICNYDFLKIDIEGYEAKVICNTSKKDWINTDAMVEVGSDKNAEIIYNFLKSIEVNMFSQKIGWDKVDSLKNMPFSYKDGSLFITNKTSVPW